MWHFYIIHSRERIYFLEVGPCDKIVTELNQETEIDRKLSNQILQRLSERPD
jgi:hypothetical protein